MNRINFYRTLEISQRLAAIQGAFIQEKQLNFGKNSKFSGLLTFPVPIPYTPLVVTLKINTCNHNEN